MAKLFGEFLVEQKVISNEVLLRALIYQMQSAPATAEVMYSEKLLSAEDQLRILSYQQCHGADYRSSAKELGLWSEFIAEKVSECIQEARRPLGEVLIKLGAISNEKLMQSLDDYIDSYSKSDEKFVTHEELEKVKYDPVLCLQYHDYFNQKILPNLNRLMDEFALSSTTQHYFECLEKIHYEFTAIRASAMFIGIQFSLHVSSDALNVLAILKSHKFQANIDSIYVFLKILMRFLQSIAEFLKRTHSEGVESDAHFKEIFDELSKSKNRLMKLLQTN